MLPCVHRRNYRLREYCAVLLCCACEGIRNYNAFPCSFIEIYRLKMVYYIWTLSSRWLKWCWMMMFEWAMLVQLPRNVVASQIATGANLPTKWWPAASKRLRSLASTSKISSKVTNRITLEPQITQQTTIVSSICAIFKINDLCLNLNN